jgi:hypothetical protein
LHRLFVAISVVAAVAVAVAVRAPSSRSGPGPIVVPRPAVVPAEPDRDPTPTPAAAPAADEVAPEDHDLLAWVDWKYRYLFDDARLDPTSRRKLIQLLVARERVIRDPDTSSERGRQGEIERQVRMLLGDADRAQYDALRDSDAEQRRLTDYGGGIDNLAPLDDDQQKRLLAAKLRHKAEFERDLSQAHLEQPVLSPEERARAHAIVNAALDRYHDAFLLEASEILDEQQFILLASYEATELEHERQRLQIAINAK